MENALVCQTSVRIFFEKLTNDIVIFGTRWLVLTVLVLRLSGALDAVTSKGSPHTGFFHRPRLWAKDEVSLRNILRLEGQSDTGL